MWKLKWMEEIKNGSMHYIDPSSISKCSIHQQAIKKLQITVLGL